MSNEKATVEEWQTARKNTKMTQPKVAKLLHSSLDAIKSWDSGRSFINRALYDYYRIMTDQHPDFIRKTTVTETETD